LNNQKKKKEKKKKMMKKKKKTKKKKIFFVGTLYVLYDIVFAYNFVFTEALAHHFGAAFVQRL